MSINTLIQNIKSKNNPTVAGLDARLSYIPTHIVQKNIEAHGETLKAASSAMYEFNKNLIDGLCDIVPAVKPQAAYYELLGPCGMVALADTIQYAKSKGMYVIADIKRNDIGATAEAYAEAYMGVTQVGNSTIESFGADSVTINAYLGTDGVEPFLKQCRERQKSIFILVKTSNKSSGEFQNKLMEGKTLFENVASMLNVWGEGLYTASTYNEVGAVVGATYPEEQKVIRDILPKAYFLVPGYGAQGATAKDIANAFNDDGLGAIVNSSRGIMCAWQKTGKDGLDFVDAARAEAIRMRDDLVSVIK